MRFDEFIEKLNKVMFGILAFLGCVMVVVGFMQVIWRYVLQSSLFWSEELLRYVNIWTIFIGIGIGIYHTMHVAIEAFPNMLKGKARKILLYFIQIVSVIFYILVAVFGTQFTVLYGNQFSPAMRIPLSAVYVAIPLGGLFGLIYTIHAITKLIKGGESQ